MSKRKEIQSDVDYTMPYDMIRALIGDRLELVLTFLKINLFWNKEMKKMIKGIFFHIFTPYRPNNQFI